uniref:N-acyl-aliphatic-L-amino acid amidohydrolase n=1 Tax=Panagrellus redivivus TaxID=6233 RepID=A0A7E4VIH8_PANRE
MKRQSLEMSIIACGGRKFLCHWLIVEPFRVHICQHGLTSRVTLCLIPTMATEDIAVTRFREYIRIDTEQPNPDYEKAYEFLANYAKELGLEASRVDVLPGRPMVILKLAGSQPQLKSLMLYSHIDVVPTYKDKWTYPPYSATKDANGRIYGRGTQDMKSVGIQYLEAYRKLKAGGKAQFLRTIYFVFGADEEIGGPAMDVFVKSPEFKGLNLGFTLDEGVASETDVYNVYYGERCPWWIEVSFQGTPGHGSRFIENDAATKLQKFLNLAYAFRQEQKDRLNDGKLTLGDVTTINMTQLAGGVQTNVVPDVLKATFDIRVTPAMLDDFEDRLKSWCKQAGPDVTYVFTQKTVIKNLTPTTDADPHWKVFSETLKGLGLKFTTQIFIGATDSRYLRGNGYKSIGFSPMANTPILLHDHDEYLDESVFLKGVDVYVKLIDNLANISAEADSV